MQIQRPISLVLCQAGKYNNFLFVLFPTLLTQLQIDGHLFIMDQFNRWSFLYSAEAIRKQEYHDILPRASIKDLGVILTGAGYEVLFLFDISFFPRFFSFLVLLTDKNKYKELVWQKR